MMTNDPFEAATEAGERQPVRSYFGKIDCSAQFVVLVKGSGKQAYNEHLHKPEDRRTEVAIVLNPLDAMGLRFNVERSILAESREFNQIVWPSLRDLGCKSLREIHGKYAQIELVDSGRKWVDRNGNERTQTTIRFVALYSSEAECVAAYESRGGAVSQNNGSNGTGSQPASDNEKAAALEFLKVIVKNAGGDRNTVATMIAGMPMIAKYYTIDSPEVAELLKVTA